MMIFYRCVFRISCRIISLLVSCFLCSGCVSFSALALDDADSGKRTIYIVNHGLHTGIVIDADSATEILPRLQLAIEDIQFIEFGWGDRNFYQANSFSVFLAIKALFLPTKSVMHVASIPRHPMSYFQSDSVESVPISLSHLRLILGFISRTFTRDRQGDIIQLGQGLYADSAFYAAFGNYHLLKNCNTWVIEAFAEAGFPKPVLPALTASSVMRQVRIYKHIQPIKVTTDRSD